MAAVRSVRDMDRETLHFLLRDALPSWVKVGGPAPGEGLAPGAIAWPSGGGAASGGQGRA